jgi:hypothetical protein
MRTAKGCTILNNQPFIENKDAGAFAQVIVDTVREPLLVLDKDLRVLAASRSFYLTFKVARTDAGSEALLHEFVGAIDFLLCQHLLTDRPMRATTWPALTMSPSSASISEIRPANLVSMSIPSASIRPLPEAVPDGNCDRECCHQ